jgi:glycosyltransferase involved in cell wall biosynthesis
MSLPAQQLKKAGYTVAEVFFTTVDPNNLIAKTAEGKTVNLKKADIIIFQIVMYEALVDIIRRVKALGIRTFMDIDDNYYALPADNPAFNSTQPFTTLMKDKDDKDKLVFMKQPQMFKETYTRYGKRYVRDRKATPRVNFTLEHLEESMKLVDVLQVSTPQLRDVYQKFNKNTIVLPNCLDMSLYDKVRQERYKEQENRLESTLVNVGWFGTKTHAADLQILDGLIPDNCKFTLIGVENLVENEHLFRGVKNLELKPAFGAVTNLPEAIKYIDIGVCPLVDNQFNRGKSELKAMEFNAMGIPVIASAVAPYERYITRGCNGFLIDKNKTKFWIRALKGLIEDTEFREVMGKAGLEVAQETAIEKNIYLWKEAYK